MRAVGAGGCSCAESRRYGRVLRRAGLARRRAAAAAASTQQLACAISPLLPTPVKMTTPLHARQACMRPKGGGRTEHRRRGWVQARRVGAASERAARNARTWQNSWIGPKSRLSKK